MKTQLFLAFGSIVMLSLTSADVSHVYCGRQLAQTLDVLCDKYTEKKSAPSYNALDGFGWPWLRQHRARALASVRGKRGVADECCDKACTLNELLSYC
ncbi:Bombyxin A1-like protein [Operophtera brumata]|uniref:Bombyxin A1-like protein n=1 Tax=Operophtera brumata TaxID=104452 RepID=A0A0L7KP19_OPEBR|nr:Bombyxin A1-like protein [Operophtera brumata]KOB77585.1 Bombyxin A1-like protein [Operophtera brumata]